MNSLIHGVWQRLRSPGSKALILMYHRVAAPPADPWQIAVSPANFEQQLQHISRHWNPISLAQLLDDVQARRVQDRSIVLTFDDGYTDNFTIAAPLLERYQIPATFFITTWNCEQQQAFWWDELLAIIFDTAQLPPQLIIPVAGTTFTFDLGAEIRLSPSLSATQKQWKAIDAPPTRRCRLYYDLWCRLRPLMATEQQAVLARLRQWAGLPEFVAGLPTAMNPDQLLHLAANPLFTIGAHTVTHPALAGHADAVCRDEIQRGRQWLETTIGNTITLFAYPYGNYNADTLRIVSQTPFTGAVTTKEGNTTRVSPVLELPRYQVDNWPGITFTDKLREWHEA